MIKRATKFHPVSKIRQIDVRSSRGFSALPVPSHTATVIHSQMPAFTGQTDDDRSMVAKKLILSGQDSKRREERKSYCTRRRAAAQLATDINQLESNPSINFFPTLNHSHKSWARVKNELDLDTSCQERANMNLPTP